jgi:hypothetical protein
MSDIDDLIKASLLANIQNPSACEKINNAGTELEILREALHDALEVITSYNASAAKEWIGQYGGYFEKYFINWIHQNENKI